MRAESAPAAGAMELLLHRASPVGRSRAFALPVLPLYYVITSVESRALASFRNMLAAKCPIGRLRGMAVHPDDIVPNDDHWNVRCSLKSA